MADLVNLGPTMIRLVRNIQTKDAEIVAWSPSTNQMAVLWSLDWNDVPRMLQKLLADWDEINKRNTPWIPPWFEIVE